MKCRPMVLTKTEGRTFRIQDRTWNDFDNEGMLICPVLLAWFHWKRFRWTYDN